MNVYRFTPLLAVIAAALCCGLGAGTAHAASYTPATAPGVTFDQRIGASLPLAAAFRDEQGRPVRLNDYFGSRPVVLVFGYSRCPQLCSVISNGVVQMLRDLRDTAGKAYEVVYLSIDPTDTPRDLAAMKRRDVGRYGRTGSAVGWHYLSGRQDAIDAVTSAAGFHATYDRDRKLYAHASGFVVCTPDGRTSQYFFGVDFDPKQVAAAIERAASGKTGQSVYALLLLCAHGLGISGRYGALIWTALEIAVITTVVALFGGIGWMLRDEKRRRALDSASAPKEVVS